MGKQAHSVRDKTQLLEDLALAPTEPLQLGDLGKITSTLWMSTFPAHKRDNELPQPPSPTSCKDQIKQYMRGNLMDQRSLHILGTQIQSTLLSLKFSREA